MRLGAQLYQSPCHLCCEVPWCQSLTHVKNQRTMSVVLSVSHSQWSVLLLLMAYSSTAWPCPRCGASPPTQKLFSTQKKDQCSEVSGLPPLNVTRCDWVSLQAFSNPEKACVLRQQWHDGDLRQESCGRCDRRNGAICL